MIARTSYAKAKPFHASRPPRALARRQCHPARRQCHPAARNTIWLLTSLGLLLISPGLARAQKEPASDVGADQAARQRSAKMLADYFEAMSVPKPLVIRQGEDWAAHRRRLQERLLECVGLDPLPERVPLDVRQSEPLDHPWCTVRRVHYRLWPGVYTSGLLFMPKKPAERPAPAMLCPHGHWAAGNADPVVQTRCLNFARLGYVTFSSTQNHYEDLPIGVSHQTVMIWTNVRALDYLESLPEVDKARIGAAGESGGGLQTQMLTALDRRVKAATIVGLTCDFREIMFPDSTHCTCNHFPGVMQFTDHPETSTLGMPAAVQYLTMNDWTKTFLGKNFPTIRNLYAANGWAERVECRYFNSPHTYDKPMREQTYRWIERWVRGRAAAGPEAEPETKTFPVETLQKLTAAVPGEKGFAEIGRLYRARRGYKPPAIAGPADLRVYQQRMLAALKELLGEGAILPRKTTLADKQPVPPGADKQPVAAGDVVVERVGYPSEGGIVVPAIVLKPTGRPGRLPVAIVLGAQGKESLLQQSGPDSPRQRALAGSLVVLPDVRCFGELFSTGTTNAGAQRQAWERNAIVWGRPVPGMGATDVRAVLDGLAARADADVARVELVARNSGDAALVALFAAALDGRIAAVDVDLAGCSFQKGNLPVVPGVLRHGDVLQWAALVAPRKLTLRNVLPEAGDPARLAAAFRAAGSAANVKIEAK